MNTARHAPFIASPLDLWAAPRAWARALVRRVVEPRRDTLPSGSTVRHLDKGATTWIVKPLGRRVTCESGALWMCFDGEPLDVVLEPGETHLCTKTSALSMHALSPAVVRLD